MTDASTPSVSTFDIADLFSGKAYPKDTVDVFLDEATGYAIAKAEAAIKDAVIAHASEERLTELRDERDALVAKGARSKYTFHLTGVSRQDKMNILHVVTAEFPQETDFLGRVKPNPESDEKYTNLYWALHVERIVAPDGSVHAPVTEADAKLFRNNAPEPAITAVNTAIRELSEGVKNGFESLAQEHDFLSQPSLRD